MKKIVLSTVVFGTALGLAACAPEAEEADAPETAEVVAEEDSTDDAMVASDEATGELDPDGNPVDQ
ncbi:hypothetical protein [Erythrobacter sp. F6033]|uniref:hypothetical protein n=1 Tax=Erythrobacter sp. F6033 TaxID=2926401 RepID=UPI001FF130DB|nr:hypothetical protein [Erythrobacter sp. F6033]MCK0128652.1 hypothetical protein [Erythrobacter sp. F6033]